MSEITAEMRAENSVQYYGNQMRLAFQDFQSALHGLKTSHPESVPPYLGELDLDTMRDEIYEVNGYDPRTASVKEGEQIRAGQFKKQPTLAEAL